jgi:endoglucanase
MEAQPRAVWLARSLTTNLRRGRRLIAQLVAQSPDRVLVLVSAILPGRRCINSAAGPHTKAEYEAWIDALAAGIGNAKVVVILEPDSLGNVPSDCKLPTVGYPFTDEDRYAELNYAVTKLETKPQTSVYLDGTRSDWLPVGQIAKRLVLSGVQKAQGFFLNVGNYRRNRFEIKYGTWISQCIAYAHDKEEGGKRLGHYEQCADQYTSPNGPVNLNDFSTFKNVDAWYAANMGSAKTTTHFVIDTSRNAVGHWTPTKTYPDPQVWCNPPGRGAGARSTAATHVPLLDAFLWVKEPGVSDGQCTRGLGPAGTTVDPEWGQVDPKGGDWFPAAALQLAQFAKPALT